MNSKIQHTERIARVIQLSDQVFANHEKSKKWLHKTLKTLNGKTPIDMLDSEEGARIVEGLLGQLDEGYF